MEESSIRSIKETRKELECIVRGYFLTSILDEHKEEASKNLSDIKNICPYCFQKIPKNIEDELEKLVEKLVQSKN